MTIMARSDRALIGSGWSARTASVLVDEAALHCARPGQVRARLSDRVLANRFIYHYSPHRGGSSSSTRRRRPPGRLLRERHLRQAIGLPGDTVVRGTFSRSTARLKAYIQANRATTIDVVVPKDTTSSWATTGFVVRLAAWGQCRGRTSSAGLPGILAANRLSFHVLFGLVGFFLPFRAEGARCAHPRPAGLFYEP